VSLSTAKYVNNGEGTPLDATKETGWQEISKGLSLVVQGYWVLMVGGILGPTLVWLALNGGPRLPGVEFGRNECDSLLLLGLLTLAATALLSYGLVLAGQWRCLMYAPERHSAKELMYICINAVLIASLLNLVGVWVDGERTYIALRNGWEETGKLDLTTPGPLLQLASAGLGLFGSMIFSQFLRNVASCFNDRARMRSVDLNLAFVGLLLGASAGTVLCVHRLALRAELLPWLAGGWLLCFAWHLLLVRSVRRGVETGLRNLPSVGVTPAPKAGADPQKKAKEVPAAKEPRPGALHSLSGLRRMAQKKVPPRQEKAAPGAVRLHSLSGLRRLGQKLTES
jgi:hypothetical protein